MKSGSKDLEEGHVLNGKPEKHLSHLPTSELLMILMRADALKRVRGKI